MKQLMYGFDDEECTEQTFVIPCADDETLASLIRADRIADEAAAMARNDQISAGWMPWRSPIRTDRGKRPRWKYLPAARGLRPGC